MYTAAEVGAMLEVWKKRGDVKPEIIRELSESCLGWPYVYAAAGEMCTPSWRRNRMAYSNEKYAAAIKDNCPVLSGKRTSSGAAAASASRSSGGAYLQGEGLCEGCKWDGCRCFDCRGFTRWLLSQVGLSLAGGGATTQWETASNWAAKGEIKDIPRGLVCCVFKRKEGKMSHTGMYQGDGEIIHCSTTVKRDKLPGTPAWTHWGIPAGLYTDDELRKAGVNVSEGKNIPTLRRGSEGDEVEELQALLNAKYGANLEIDGKFGAKTEAAVKAFQKAHGLTADGVVGAKTRKALGFDVAENTNGHDKPETEEKDRYACVWDILYSAVGNPYGVAGIMGNLQAESGINSINLQNTGNRALGMTDAEYTDAVTSGAYSADQFIHDGYGYGIAQWTYYSRKANLLNFAVGEGLSIGDLGMQIAYLLFELQSYYKDVWATVLTAKTVREASDAVMLKYEKPANQSEENQIRRAELGQKFFDQFADVGKTSDPGPMDGPVGDPAEWDDEEAADGVWMPRHKLKEIYAALANSMGIVKSALEWE